VSAADATERPAWHVLLGVVGAATGIVVFVGFVGGAIVWERLRVLGLPANQGVEPLPRELFLVVGARALAWPLGLGFLAIVVVHALCRLPLSKRAAPAARLALVGLFGAALGLTAQYQIRQQAIFVGFFGLLVGAGAALVGRRRAKLGQVSVGLFVSLALVGVVVEAIDIYHPPVHLEYAHVFYSDGRREASGFFIGETADTVYIAPNENCYVFGLMIALPRHEISQLDMSSPEEAWPLSAYPRKKRCETPR
jgi:hypothetical protein